MIQKEKQLLLKDLCARLPHYTMVLMDDGGVELLVSVNVDTGICNGLKGLPKPYLRPMSSMTTEECKEYDSLCGWVYDEYNAYRLKTSESYDWLNAYHFDYRGLIEKGLALEAPEDMYKDD